MPDSMINELQKDLQCEHILDCMYGLKSLDKKCYKIILDSNNPVTSSHIATEVDRDASTVSRSLNRLIDSELIYKEKRTLSNGYEYVYDNRNIDEIIQSMEELVSNWEQKINLLINEFESKYSN